MNSNEDKKIVLRRVIDLVIKTEEWERKQKRLNRKWRLFERLQEKLINKKV